MWTNCTTTETSITRYDSLNSVRKLFRIPFLHFFIFILKSLIGSDANHLNPLLCLNPLTTNCVNFTPRLTNVKRTLPFVLIFYL